MAVHPGPGRLRELPLLPVVYGLDRIAELGPRARLHLHEHDQLVTLHDEINVATPGTKSARENLPPAALEPPRGNPLAKLTEVIRNLCHSAKVSIVGLSCATNNRQTGAKVRDTCEIHSHRGNGVIGRHRCDNATGGRRRSAAHAVFAVALCSALGGGNPVAAMPTPAPSATGAEPAHAPRNATIIWQDTFDSLLTDPLALANYVTVGAEGIHVDAGGGLGGSGALRIDWTPQNGTCQEDAHLIERALPGIREIFVQYSVRYSPHFAFDWTQSGHSGCAGNAKKLLLLASTNGSPFNFASENHLLGMGSENDRPLFAAKVGPRVTDEQLGDGTWHRVTMHIIQSSSTVAADGLIEGWIDGVKEWYVPKWVSASSGGWSAFRMPTTFDQGSPVVQSEWIDNLTLWRP